MIDFTSLLIEIEQTDTTENVSKKLFSVVNEAKKKGMKWNKIYQLLTQRGCKYSLSTIKRLYYKEKNKQITCNNSFSAKIQYTPALFLQE